MRNFYLKESDLLERMQVEVMPYLNKARTEGYFEGYDKNKIHYVKYTADNPVATVVISHGFTESAEKWHELSFYFLKSGWNVYIIEHRGHGLSHRSSSDFTLTHIDNFDEYVKDFELFTQMVRKKSEGDIYLFAHSMGGAIGTLFMERHPDFFKKAVLSSPMIAPSSGNVPVCLARLILRGAVLFGKGEKRAFISSEYKGEELFENSEKTSEVRFMEYELLKRADCHLQNYCMTYGWGMNAFKVTGQIFKKGAPEKIHTSVLIAIAGKDRVVLKKPQLNLAKRLKNCKVHIYEEAKHEIFGSTDEVAFEYFDEVLEFFEKSVDIMDS